MAVPRALHDWRLLRYLAVLGAASAAAMVHGGASGRTGQVTASALLFALAAGAVAIWGNIEAWRRAPLPDARANVEAARGALLCNAWIGAAIYAWGAISMQGLYLTPLTGLKWQHGWQYAAAMALLAAGSVVFARTMRVEAQGEGGLGSLDRHGRLAIPLAMMQGLIAAGGLAALATTGKLASMRADWAANRVFAGLAAAIIAISVATVVSHMRLRRTA